MGYVEPNSVIQFFKGINLDNRYLHTIYFANANAQDVWFSSKANRTLQKHSFQRYGVEQIKVQGDVTDYLEYTYIRFKNDRNVDMWFYAFIKLVEYVNENTVLITYEIDVMQTWFIQKGTLLPCFIERQHVNDDTFGINLEAEPVGSDVYDFTEIPVDNVATDFSNFNIVYCTTDEPQSNEMVRDGIVCGATYNNLPKSSATSGVLKNELLQALGSWDKKQQKADIVDMFMFPTAFCNVGHNSATYHVIHDGMLDNYTPKNNKLHSYPYSSLYITTNDATTAMYKWEYFDGDIVHNPTGAQFELNATLTGGGYIELHPSAYNGITENFDAKIVMQNFPKCSWNYDAYQAWIASGGQYKTQYDLNMIQQKGALAIAKQTINDTGALASTGFSIAEGDVRPSNLLKYGTQAMNSYLNQEQLSLKFSEARDKVSFRFNDARYEPNIVVGEQVPNISVGKGYLCFKFFKLHVRDDEAKRIDDFFSVYGYAINKVETPNLTGRQYWNFIKTRNAEISGNMPASSKSAIGRIFDGGITFWHNGDNVGNYAISVSQGSINNPIV